MRRRRSVPLLRAIGAGLLLPAITIGTVAAAPRDRSMPSAPTNLRVTATTPYSISLAWGAAKDNVGVTEYRVCCANGGSQTVAAPATSMTFTAGVEPSRTFTLQAFARDAAGNWSKASNSVTVTTPADRTSPSQPVVSVTDIGATFVSISWSSTDDSPKLWFHVFHDGEPLLIADRRTSLDVGFLAPETTHSFTVQARDFAGNLSPISAPVTATTEARDGTDTTPPTMPGNMFTFLAGPDGETWLIWDESTDDVTPQSLIVYEIFINGQFDSGVLGFHRGIVYGPPQSTNTYTVVAVDDAGNRSEPASIVVDNF